MGDKHFKTSRPIYQPDEYLQELVAMQAVRADCEARNEICIELVRLSTLNCFCPRSGCVSLVVDV
jgi:hypothetical protein